MSVLDYWVITETTKLHSCIINLENALFCLPDAIFVLAFEPTFSKRLLRSMSVCCLSRILEVLEQKVTFTELRSGQKSVTQKLIWTTAETLRPSPFNRGLVSVWLFTFCAAQLAWSTCSAELRQPLGCCHCLIVLVQKTSFLQATTCFLNNSMSAFSNRVTF